MRGILQIVRQSYALKLLVAFGMISVLVGGFAVAVGASTQSVAESNAENQLRTDAERQAAVVERWSNGIEQRARRLAGSEAAMSGDADEIQKQLSARAGDLGEGVVAIHYVDDGGIAASTEQTAGLPDSVLDVAATGEASFTSAFDSPQVAGRAVAYVLPTSEGAFVYVLDPRPIVEGYGASSEGSSRVSETALIGEEQRIIAATDSDLVGATVSGLSNQVTAVESGTGESGAVRLDSPIGTDSGSETTTDVVVGYAGVPGTPWSVTVQRSASEVFAVADYAQSAIAGLALMSLVSLVLFGSTVGSTTVIQTRDLQERAGRVANGDMDVKFPTRRSDEFGDVRESLDTMRVALTEQIEAAEAAEQEAESARADAEALSAAVTDRAEEYATELEAAADGDLTRRVDVLTDGDRSDAEGLVAMRRIGVAVNSVLDSYEDTIRDLSEFADVVETASKDVSDSADDASRVADEIRSELVDIEQDADDQREEIGSLASEIEQLSATAEEIAATTDRIETASTDTVQAAQEGADSAEDAMEAMEDTVETIDATVTAVNDLADRADEVTEVVDLISDIADETDMLAINASIEAARAGGDGSDADGEGFAVVAEEVKNLAGEAKESAEQVNDQLEAMRDQTEVAVEKAEEADLTLQEGSETVEESLTQLGEIADLAEEANQSIAEISEATADLASSTESASAAVQQVEEISEETAKDASQLVDVANDQQEVITTVSSTVETLADNAERLRASLEEFTLSGTQDDVGAVTRNQQATTDD